MSVQHQKRKRGGDKKHGRSKRKPCNQRYVRENRWFKNKRKRVRQSCGEAFARAWEREYYVKKRRAVADNSSFLNWGGSDRPGRNKRRNRR